MKLSASNRSGSLLGGASARLWVVLVGAASVLLGLPARGDDSAAVVQEEAEVIEYRPAFVPDVYFYDYVNRSFPFTPLPIWREMFSSLDERQMAEERAFGVPGESARERYYHKRQAKLHPVNRPLSTRYHSAVISDPGIYYEGGGMTAYRTSRGIVVEYNPRYNPLGVAAAKIHQEAVRRSLRCWGR